MAGRQPEMRADGNQSPPDTPAAWSGFYVICLRKRPSMTEMGSAWGARVRMRARLDNSFHQGRAARHRCGSRCRDVYIRRALCVCWIHSRGFISFSLFLFLNFFYWVLAKLGEWTRKVGSSARRYSLTPAHALIPSHMTNKSDQKKNGDWYKQREKENKKRMRDRGKVWENNGEGGVRWEKHW